MLANRTLKRSSSGFVRLTKSLKVTSKSSLWLLWSLQHVLMEDLSLITLWVRYTNFKMFKRAPENRNKVALENTK